MCNGIVELSVWFSDVGVVGQRSVALQFRQGGREWYRLRDQAQDKSNVLEPIFQSLREEA